MNCEWRTTNNVSGFINGLIWWFLRVMPFINSNYVFVFNVYPAIHYVYQSTNWGAWGYVSLLTFSFLILKLKHYLWYDNSFKLWKIHACTIYKCTCIFYNSLIQPDIDAHDLLLSHFTSYPEDDPMVVFMNEFDGTPLAGEKWDAESDCIFLDKAMDGAGKYRLFPMYHPSYCKLERKRKELLRSCQCSIIVVVNM